MIRDQLGSCKWRKEGRLEINNKENSFKFRNEEEDKRKRRKMKKKIIQRKEMKELMMTMGVGMEMMMVRILWMIRDLRGCFKLKKMEKKE